MKTITIIDIAKAAGVSIKTVSRVFNNEPNVRPTTRDKVLAAAKALNYRPNVSARSLASNKSYIVIHFHDNTNSDYLQLINQSSHKACRKAQYFFISEPLDGPDIQDTDSYATQIDDYLAFLKVDGIILSPPLSDDKDVLESLRREGIPHVRISPYIQRDTSTCTFVDDHKAASLVTDHLIGLGHKKIAFISGPRHHGASSLRLKGFLDTLRNHDIPTDLCPQLPGDFTFRSGFFACETLFENSQGVTAIFAANDEMAVGAMMAALKAGLRVPEDLSIAGFDGSRISDIVWPPLTTVRQPIRLMAQHAIELLLKTIKSPETDWVQKEMPIELMPRGTTAKLGHTR